MSLAHFSRRVTTAAMLIALLLAVDFQRGQAQQTEPQVQAENVTADERPDVLFLIVDDLNDWNTLLKPDAPIETPNLIRLAKRGTLFRHAYCASPACNPSRVAALTGLRPTTSGVYGNKSDWRGALPNRKTVMQRFMDAGYEVRGAGKIFHHHLDGAFHDPNSFHQFQPMRPQVYPREKLNRATGYGSRNTDWGAWPEHVEETIDFHTVSDCVRTLHRRDRSKPLFYACGIFKPHSPFFSPESFHDGLEKMERPRRDEDDWSDLPSGAANLLRNKKWFWNGIMKVEQQRPGSYDDFLRAYAACVRFADAQIGRVLDALESSGRMHNTVVVLWSDHGFHLGEKDHLEKFALWEKSNHIPLIIVAPGKSTPGSRCDQPVDTTTLYPTLLELAGIPPEARCDGVSVVPLLLDPTSKWERPALMTYQRGNHAVRSRRWRYIRYADGSEELYDHRSDPDEWHNLIDDEKWLDVIKQHRRWLPKQEAKPFPDLKRREQK